MLELAVLAVLAMLAMLAVLELAVLATMPAVPNEWCPMGVPMRSMSCQMVCTICSSCCCSTTS